MELVGVLIIWGVGVIGADVVGIWMGGSIEAIESGGN